MEFLENIRSATSVPASWGSILAIVIAFVFALYIWRRTRSTYSVMVRLWQLFHGKKECKEGPVRDFLDQQSALMQFRFTTGVPARTLKQTQALIEWAEKNNEDMGDVAACGGYFDLERIQLKEEDKLAKRWTLIFLFVAAAMFGVVSVGSLIGTTYDKAILQMKQSRVYFTFSLEYARPIGSDKGLSREQCTSGETAISSEFSPADASIICKLFKDKSLAPYVIKTVRDQRVAFAFIAVSFAWYFWGVFSLFLQGAKSREMFKRLQKKPEQEPLELVSNN